MIINTQNLDLAFRGFSQKYSDAFMEAKSHSDKIVMKVPSTARDETYSWFGAFPNMREWLGPRVLKNLSANSFTIVNRLFESTVRVSRNDIEDDRLGVFGPAFTNMGQLAKRHPEELVFGLLKAGFATNCFDGQFFFDTDHPLEIENVVTSVSNMQAGAGDQWYLLDCSGAIRPLVWQERVPYTFESLANPGDPDVFMRNEFTYGVRARVNCGYGLWQLAFGSKAALDATNYAAARAAMMGMRADGGRILGVTPTHLVVPPSLEAAALALVNSEYGTGGISNPWKGTVELVVSQYLA